MYGWCQTEVEEINERDDLGEQEGQWEEERKTADGKLNAAKKDLEEHTKNYTMLSLD
jgi:hypothetical protein